MIPEFIITTEDNKTPRSVLFKDLFSIKDKLTKLILLWLTNSYVVDCDNNIFIINGGKKITFENLISSPTKIFYARRNYVDMSLDGFFGSKRQAYIIGLESRTEGKKLLLQISEDGTMFSWRTLK